jgi:hypothetical protein
MRFAPDVVCSSREEAYAAYPPVMADPISWLGTPLARRRPGADARPHRPVTEARGFTPNVWRSLALGEDRLADAFGYCCS